MNQFFLVILSSLFVLTSWADQPRIFTITGKELKGKTLYHKRGVVLQTENGAKLYQWEVIKINSLPEKFRIQKRFDLDNELDLANALYEEKRFKQAALHFKNIWIHRTFFTNEERKDERFEDIDRKKDGLIFYNEEWVTFQSIQIQKGLTKVGRYWLNEEQLKKFQELRLKLQKVLYANLPEPGMRELNELIKQYPERFYRERILAAYKRLEDYNKFLNTQDFMNQAQVLRLNAMNYMKYKNQHEAEEKQLKEQQAYYDKIRRQEQQSQRTYYNYNYYYDRYPYGYWGYPYRGWSPKIIIRRQPPRPKPMPRR
ncbi:MAG: hypothetical protein MK193_00560 [Lentisphaeria bacterium]|nr:hypothetical protein [Lentisphaeria bacterium]